MFFTKNAKSEVLSFVKESAMKIPEIDNLHIYNRDRKSRNLKIDVLDYIRSSTMEYLEMYSFKNMNESKDVRYVVMQYISNILVFRVENISEYLTTKGIFKKKNVILWDELRRKLIETYSMSNNRMLNNSIRMTTFGYGELFNKSSIRNMDLTDEEVKKLDHFNVQELFEVKFKLDQYSYLLEDIEIFNQSSKDDAFYEEMYNKIIKSYGEAEILNKQYLNTLNDFYRRVREDKQLNILSRN